MPLAQRPLISSADVRSRSTKSHSTANAALMSVTSAGTSPAPASRMTAVSEVTSRPPALSRQLPVLNPVRLVGVGAEATVAIGLVVLVVALEPDNGAVALEREHVRCDAIQEPAVVADDNGAACEIEQGILYGA